MTGPTDTSGPTGDEPAAEVDDEGRDVPSVAAPAALDRLEAESRRREQELHRLADDVPAAVSRIAVLRSMAGGLRDLVPPRRRP